MKTKHLSLLIAMLLVPLYIFANRSDVVTANTLGGSVSFSTDGQYEWVWDGVNKRLQSTNYGISNSTSQTTISFSTSKSGLVSFDYAVSSEQNCDVLTILLDGTTIVNGASGTINSSVMCPVISTGSHTLIVKYTKDSSKNTNNDCAYISNLQLNDKITGTCGSTAYYEYNAETQTLKITGEGAMNNYSSTNMPWNVVKQQIKNIEIGESITSIGDYAFYGCNGISDITIPENVSHIGQGAFSNCINLSKLTYNAINAAVSTSTSYLSFPTTITNVTLGNKVETIPSYFLYNCSKINNISLPQTLKVIGSQAFYNCSGITNVVIPENVTSIGQSAFTGTSLNSIAFNAKNATVYSNTSYPSFPTTVSNITFGEDVETIPDYLCYNWTNLKSVVLPTKLKNIGSYSFRNCTGITAIDVPNNVTSIGNYAFYGCGLKSLNLGSSLLSIGQNAFYNCSGISSVTIPNTVTTVGNSAFDGCNLTSLTVGAGVTKMENYAFGGNYGQKPIKTIWLCNTAPSGFNYGVGTINYAANNAFSSSGSWKIYKYISSAFVVDGIKYVPVSPSDRTCDAIDCVYDETSENTKISETVSYKKIAMSVINVNPYTCYGNTYIKNAEVTSSGILGNYVFYGCSNMESATIGDKITSIGSYAFSGCTALQSIIIPESVTSLGTYCFQNCSSIPEITIPEATKSVGDYAFYGCKRIADVKIADRTTSLSLGSNGSSPLFSSCPLKTVYIGGKISYNTGSNYGYSPFYRNTSLESVVITDTEEQIYNNEFYGCTSLKNVKIGDGVKNIGNWAFSGCSSLEEFSFGNSMQSIGQEAFSDCVNITKITALTAVPPVCGSQALDDINKWECELSVPVESVDDYYDAPQWKEFFFIEGVETYTMALSDANTEIKEGTFDTGTVGYSRTGSSIADGKYGSFCLPFKIDLNETTCFKKVYIPAGFVLYNTNSGNICIMFDSYPMNSSIPAGTPFVAILNGNPVQLTNSQVEKYTSAEPATITTTMNVYNYSGDGALWQKEDMHVIYGGTYDKKQVTDSGVYSFSSTGNFGDKAIGSTLSPFRNYIQVVTDGSEVKVNNVEVKFDDDEDATAIRELLFNGVSTDLVDVYNVNGIKVKNHVDASSALEGLSKGVYIVNGKKVIVK